METGPWAYYPRDMSRPLTRVERDSPPPRRKSCLACVKSKRRCNQRFPSCLRCAQRRIPCEYAAQVPQSSRAESYAEAEPTALLVTRQDNGEREALQDKTVSCESWMTTDEYTPCPELSWSVDHENIPLDESITLAVEPAPEWSTMMRLDEFAPLEDICRGPELPLHPIVMEMASTEARPTLQVMSTGYFNMEAVSTELDRNLSYAVEKIKASPSTMFLELQTPWCHASLYRDEMPRVMQGQCCCFYEALIWL